MALVTAVFGFDATLDPESFEPSEAERRDIARVWRGAVAKRPKLFDGAVLLARSVVVAEGRARIGFVRTSFAVYLWRQSMGFPDDALLNVFGGAVVVSSDGAALLGRMGQGTANPGAVYFPAGTPDLSDVAGDHVDLEGSILRELKEETGLSPLEVRPSERRALVVTGGLIACLRRFDVALDAEALAAAVRRHIAREADPELDAVVMARGVADLDDTSPPYVHAGLPAMLG